MKLAFAVPTVAALLAMTGCTTLLSTSPFVPEDGGIVEPALAGVWANDKDTVIIRQRDKAYDITYLEDGKTALKFGARMVKTGDALLLDLWRDSDDPFVLTLHAVVRVWPGPGALRWTFLDSDWLKEQVARTLPTQREGDRTITTAGETAVRDLVLKLGADEKADGNVEVWTRVQ